MTERAVIVISGAKLREAYDWLNLDAIPGMLIEREIPGTQGNVLVTVKRCPLGTLMGVLEDYLHGSGQRRGRRRARKLRKLAELAKIREADAAMATKECSQSVACSAE